MVKRSSLNEVASAISRLNTILVVSHYNPDADAYGSSSGLGQALREAGKRVWIANETELIEKYAFIPGAASILNDIPDEIFDGIIVCDCGGLERAGTDFSKYIMEQRMVINIDHHLSNEHFGTVNYVVESASSTCELIFDIVKCLGIPLSKPVATCLYSGILGDTGSFAYSTTTPRVFGIAKELVEAGASPGEISTAFFDNNTIGATKLHAEALCNLVLYHHGQIAEAFVSLAMLSKHSASSDETEGLAEKVRSIKGVRVSISIREEKDLLKISLRGKDPAINLSLVAQHFGGGGHKSAAAFRWRRSLDELRTELIPVIVSAITAADS